MSKIRIIFDDIVDHLISWKEYWVSYGGLTSIIGSLYFWFAIIGAMLLPKETLEKFAGNVMTVNPSLIGFSIAGFTLYLTLLSDKLSPDQNDKMSAQFTHFIIIQTLTLLLTYLCELAGVFPIIIKILFLYSILLIFSITFAFFHIAQLISEEKRRNK